MELQPAKHFCYSGENVTKSKVPTAVVPGDHIIPMTVSVVYIAHEGIVNSEYSTVIQLV